MNIKKKWMLRNLFLVGIFLIILSVLSSAETYTKFSFNPFNTETFTSETVDEKTCNSGNDFIIQVAPLGCTPSVVRSDLLEEQNVPVFCQLVARQVNPLMKVGAIDSVSLSGKYPDSIASINFHPANAALGLKTGNLDNIGYAMIVLKQNKNESSMPEFISGNLTAKLKYNFENIFGIGDAKFYLSEIKTESEWQEKFPQYSFWNRKGYLRLENINDKTAIISVYNSNLKKISTATLEEGKLSESIIIPGFDYCSGGMQLKLDDLALPVEKVKIKVNEDAYEVSAGETFLDNKCHIDKEGITKDGLMQSVQISCQEDTGKTNFPLKIFPAINLTIDGKGIIANVGDFLYKTKDNKNSVYLGYVGSKKDSTENLDDLFIYLVSIPGDAKKLSKEELDSINNIAKSLKKYKITGSQEITSDWLRTIKNVGEGIKNLATQLEDWRRGKTEGGKKYVRVEYKDEKGSVKIIDVLGKQIQIISFADAIDKQLDDASKTFYDNAKDDYFQISKNYEGEIYNEKRLGEEALYSQIELADSLKQYKTLIELCREFREQYPASKKNLDKCEDKYKLSNTEFSTQIVMMNGKEKKISFEGIQEPAENELSVEISVKYPDGIPKDFTLLNKEIIYLSPGENNDFIQLSGIDDNFADFKASNSQGELKIDKGDASSFTGKESGKNYVIKLEKINIKKRAKVSLIPKITKGDGEATFNFRVEIEKRLDIPLAPEMIKKEIGFLDNIIGVSGNISSFLNSTVSIGTMACMGTGLALTAKNLVLGTQGEGIARQYIMRGKDSWNERCTDLVNKEKKFDSLEKCFLAKAPEIDADVQKYTEIIKKQNEKIKEIEANSVAREAILEKIINTKKFVEQYSAQVSALIDKDIANPENQNEKITSQSAKNLISLGNWESNNYNVEDLKEIELYLLALKSDANDERAKKRLYSLFSKINTTTGKSAEKTTLAGDLGVSPEDINLVVIGENVEKRDYHGMRNNGKISGIENSAPIEIVQASDGKNYILVLDDSAGTKNLPVLKKADKPQIYDAKTKKLVESKDIPEISSMYFVKYEKGIYQNTYKASSGDTVPLLKYHETEPYKGKPALVPFDLKEGWYAATKNILPIFSGTTTRTFDDSGRVNSFYLCNVGEDGIEEFYSGFGDDKCTFINLGINAPYNVISYLDKQKASDLVTAALNALTEAEGKYATGVRNVVINGKSIKVGSPASDIPDIQCQDFMSPTDCQILFNVCDPVLCPASRCDFGGLYQSRDVIQSGIIGSTLLCMPNSVAFGGDVVVPVCLTGVYAGLDNLNSFTRAYRDCLQNHLDTGETRGICDEFRSIYMCDTIWREAKPLAEIISQKLINFVSGENNKGGGEYLSVTSALENAKNSINYLLQYSGDSLKAFKGGDISEIGTSLCKNFMSLSIPKAVDLIYSISEPSSPPQFQGWFDEISFTSITVPPISQYKVFYHIYAGKNSGAYYNVYLKGSSESSFYQDTKIPRVVASGYIPAGEYASETKDFTAASGYKQLCIDVNGQEICDFKEVSTSFAVDYIKDKYLTEQINQTKIQTTEECASLNDLGIVRICSTDNPQKGTDSKADAIGSRWTDVGFCDNEKLRCWLDTQSVKDTIESPDIEKFFKTNDTVGLEEGVLKEVSKKYLDALKESEGKITSEDDFKKKVEEITLKQGIEKIRLIEDIIDKISSNNQKAYLLLLRGDAYKILAVKSLSEQPKTVSEPAVQEKKPADESFNKNVKKYQEFRDFFEKYSTINLPNGWLQNNFKALLVSIAQEETDFDDKSSNPLMGYHPYNRYYSTAKKQIERASLELKSALNKENKKYYSKENPKCDDKDYLKCVLSVYRTEQTADKSQEGKEDENKIFANKNQEGKEYADRIMEKYAVWKNYFETEKKIEVEIKPEDKSMLRYDEYVVPSSVSTAAWLAVGVNEIEFFKGLYISEDPDVSLIPTITNKLLDWFPLFTSHRKEFEKELEKTYSFSNEQIKYYYGLLSTPGNIIIQVGYENEESTIFHERIHKIINEALTKDEINTLISARNLFLKTFSVSTPSSLKDSYQSLKLFFSEQTYKFFLERHWEELYVYMAENDKFKLRKQNENYYTDPATITYFSKNYSPAYKIYKKVYELASALGSS